MAVLSVQVAEATVQAAGIKKLYANTYSFLTILPSNNGIYPRVVYSTSDDTIIVPLAFKKMFTRIP